MRRTDALIVGGGPAGTAAAIRLARAGARPLLIERTRDSHDVVCGGFMGWDALKLLDRLGLDAWSLGAHPIRRVRVIAGARSVEAALPHAAAGLSRRALDAALLAAAIRAGAAVERGVSVRHLASDTHKIGLADGAELAADALFVATGKHRLRGVDRPHGASLGLRATLKTTPALVAALAGTIELHLFEQGYAGLLLQEDGSANLCLSVAATRAADGVGPLLAQLTAEAPMLGDRIAAAGRVGAWSSVAGVPYGWRAEAGSPGLFRLGDQAAVIASLAGDGVAIAVASGAMAAAHWLEEGADGALRFQRRFARRAARPIGVAERLRRQAERPRVAGPLVGLLRHVPQALTLGARLTRIGH